MLNDNKISEIKIIIDGLLKDVDTLSQSEMISHLKWEEILMSASLISLKLNTLRIEQERNNMARYLLKEDANSQFDSSDNEFKRLAYTIVQLKKEMSEMRSNMSNTFLPESDSLDNHESEQEHAIEQKHKIEQKFEVEQRIEVEKEGEVEQIEEEMLLIEVEPLQAENEPELEPKPETEFEPEQLEIHQNELDSDPDELDFLLDKRSLMDIAVPYSSDPEWMKDMPGMPVDDLRMAVTLNDKLFFIRELFNGDEDQYRISIDKLNDFNSFSQALEYTRDAFQDWNEESDAAYRFYMTLRRRYNG